MKLQSTNAKVINSAAIDCMGEMAAALYQANHILDGEYEPSSARAVAQSAIRAALARYEASK